MCPLQSAMVAGAATIPDFAMTHAFDQKITRVGEKRRRQGIVFLSLAAESLGGWHPVAVDQIMKLDFDEGKCHNTLK